MTEQVRQADPAHARRRVRARARLFRVPHDRRADRTRRSSSICSGRRATATSRSISRPTRAGASPTAPPACSACSRTSLVDIARALQRETGPARPVLRRRRRAERRRQRADPRRVGLRARVRAAGAGRCRLRAGRGAVRRPHLLRQPRPRRARSSVLGPGRRRAPSWRAPRAKTARSSTSSTTPRCIDRVADELAAGRIVGWMDGACEFGPRALGHRSILAAPHSREMRDRLNRDIKYREEFRPFAPVVAGRRRPTATSSCRPAARGSRGSCRACFRCGPNGATRLAAVTHVDGTARVQVLERDMAPRLHALLEAYGRRTGIPVLLNTSFNLAGEPIVTRALEGYSTFRRCGIDLLVAGSTRRDQARGGAAGARWRSVAWSRKRGGIRRRLIMLGRPAARSPISRADSGARVRQALAGAAGGVPVRDRPGADRSRRRSRRWRRSSTRSSETWTVPGAARLPGVRRRCSRPDWSCVGVRRGYDAPDGIPNLRLPVDARTEAVRRFYERAPFPGYPPRDSLHRAARARRAERVRPPARSTRFPATRGSSRSAAAPARCASTSPAPTASSSAPT